MHLFTGACSNGGADCADCPTGLPRPLAPAPSHSHRGRGTPSPSLSLSTSPSSSPSLPPPPPPPPPPPHPSPPHPYSPSLTPPPPPPPPSLHSPSLTPPPLPPPPPPPPPPKSVRSSSALLQKCSLVVLQQVIKTLAARRLVIYRKVFYDVTTGLFVYVGQLWAGHLRRGVELASTGSAAAEALEMSQICLKSEGERSLAAQPAYPSSSLHCSPAAHDGVRLHSLPLRAGGAGQTPPTPSHPHTLTPSHPHPSLFTSSCSNS